MMTNSCSIIDSEQHPRIATEARDDILFLKDQLRQAAERSYSMISNNNNADKHPTSTASTEMENSIQKFLDDIFDLASDNITVNGIPYKEAFKTVDEFEPFDESLRSSVDALLTATIAAQSRVAKLRTSIPFQLVEAERMKHEESMGAIEAVATAMRSVKASNAAKDEEEKEKEENVDVEMRGIGESVIDGSGSGAQDLNQLVDGLAKAADYLREERDATLFQMGEMKKIIPTASQKWQRANIILDDMGLCPASSSSSSSTDDDVDMYRGAREEIDKTTTPRRARTGLLKTLNEDSVTMS